MRDCKGWNIILFHLYWTEIFVGNIKNCRLFNYPAQTENEKKNTPEFKVCCIKGRWWQLQSHAQFLKTDLTNGRAGKWAPEVLSNPFPRAFAFSLDAALSSKALQIIETLSIAYTTNGKLEIQVEKFSKCELSR